MADHLDDRRGRADDRLGGARRARMAEQRQGGRRLGPVDAEDVGAGEDQQAGERHDQGGRDAAGEMVERRDRGAVGMGLRRGERRQHILEGLADDKGTVESLRAISNRPAAAAPRAPGSIRLITSGGASISSAAGEVGGQQREAGRRSARAPAPRGTGARSSSRRS